MGERLNFSQIRLDLRIDLPHPFAVLGTRLPLAWIEAGLAPIWQCKSRGGVLQQSFRADLFDFTSGLGRGLMIRGGMSAAGRPRHERAAHGFAVLSRERV